ncbi:AI-2E family transporter [uncultured Rhodoferax sp.]|uniref:AI-2E family transporter n=1 Tax=uncultured Rhodoferax sp. TaxID=223188 RepID=UPI0025E3BEA1|nr:AI-2E family transporter [uncultured Rhodoferax sp.]
MTPPAAAPRSPRFSSRWVTTSSQVLVLLMCLLTLCYGLLPGLLAVCLGYMVTHAMSGEPGLGRRRLPSFWAAAVVIVLPLIGLAVIMVHAQGMLVGAVAQYEALLQHLARTVLEIRQKLPPNLAAHLPDELIAAQAWLAAYLQSQAKALTGFGSAGLQGGLLAYVGLVIGALVVGTPAMDHPAPLRAAMRKRAGHFIQAFRQIVVAQFWIAAFNALCTAIFLLAVLPLFEVHIPYRGMLVALTFFAGLIPIVGNLLCNGVLTLAGVSVAPMVGLACLMFLIAIHKFEYIINAKVVGKRTGTSAWELLTVMFVGEAIFGVAGLVAAPLYYAYVKRELLEEGLV